MSPYRDRPRAPTGPSSHDRAASYRAARVRLGVAGAALVLAALAGPLVGKGCRPRPQPLDIPEALLHRVIQRESDYRATARNGPYWGLMQILPQTARTMG